MFTSFALGFGCPWWMAIFVMLCVTSIAAVIKPERPHSVMQLILVSILAFGYVFQTMLTREMRQKLMEYYYWDRDFNRI